MSFKVNLVAVFLFVAMSNFAFGQLVTEHIPFGDSGYGLLSRETITARSETITARSEFIGTPVCGEEDCWIIYGYRCLDTYDGTLEEAEEDAQDDKEFTIEWLLDEYQTVCTSSTSEVDCFFDVDPDTGNVYIVKECKLTVIYGGNPPPDDVINDPLDILDLLREEDSVLIGDVNQDGIVDFFDIGPFLVLLGSGEFLAEADINQDGVVDFFDIGPFIAMLVNGS